jgi:hypothetical protein
MIQVPRYHCPSPSDALTLYRNFEDVVLALVLFVNTCPGGMAFAFTLRVQTKDTHSQRDREGESESDRERERQRER